MMIENSCSKNSKKLWIFETSMKDKFLSIEKYLI